MYRWSQPVVLADTPSRAAPTPPLTGDLIVQVWDKTPGGRKGARIDDPGVLPVRAKELVRLTTRLSRPAYVYLLWIDGRGQVSALYPWDRSKKQTIHDPPPLVPPQTEVESPEPKAEGDERVPQGWPLEGSSGLETILLLARQDALSPQIQLPKLLGRLPATPLRDPCEVAVMGRDGNHRLPTIGWSRGPAEQAEQIDDPFLALMERLGPHFETIRMVRFAYQGTTE
jgi:hypothetical protein